MNTYITLSDELKNNIITFVDGFGKTFGIFDFIEKKSYFYGDLTHDIEVRLIKKSKKSKYNKMLNINNNYYYGDLNQTQRNNIMGKFFKISIQHHNFGKKYEYILLIL